MKKMFSVFLFLFALPLAHADQMTCRYADDNGDEYVGIFTRNNGDVNSEFRLNGVEIPAVHTCIAFVPGRFNPRMGAKVRCPHGMAEIRFEVYPVFSDNGFGREASMSVIRWNGDQLFSTIKSTNCK